MSNTALDNVINLHADLLRECVDNLEPSEYNAFAIDTINARAELAALSATVAALTAERDAAYRRGWDAAIDAACEVVQSELDWLRDEDDKRFAYGKRIMSSIRAMQPTERDAAMLEAWHERL